jgi:hypothetical protein
LRAIIRCGAIGHAFHAAGDDHVGAAGQQHVVAEHRRAHAAAAHLGQGHRAGAVGQAGAAQRLPSRRLALAGHQAVAHQHLVDAVARYAGTLDAA